MVTSKWIIDGIAIEYVTPARTLGSMLDTNSRGTARADVFMGDPSLSRRHLIARETSRVAVPRSSNESFCVKVSNSAVSIILGLIRRPPSGSTNVFSV